jgi:phage protein U
MPPDPSYTKEELPVLTLGGFPFRVTTASFSELSRSTQYQWSAQQRLCSDPAFQFTGYGEDVLALPCVIYPGNPGLSGDASALADLRHLADLSVPHRLTDNKGTDHGRWFISEIAETHSHFFSTGSARKIEFTLTIKRYSTK